MELKLTPVFKCWSQTPAIPLNSSNVNLRLAKIGSQEWWGIYARNPLICTSIPLARSAHAFQALPRSWKTDGRNTVIFHLHLSLNDNKQYKPTL